MDKNSCPLSFIINLPEDRARRDVMKERIEKTNTPYAFVEAVNGRNFDLANTPEYNRNKRLRYFGRDLIGGEIGCLLSHRKIYEKMIKEKIPHAVILEDDVIFEPEYKEVLQALIDTKTHWDVIRFLGSKKIYKRGHRKITPLTDKYWLARLPTTPGGAHGYLMSLKAAKTMVKHMQSNWIPIDTLQGRMWETGLETLVVYPAPLHIDQTVETTIGNMRLDKNLQIKGLQKKIFPLFRGWYRLYETLGKQYIFWSALPKDALRRKKALSKTNENKL